MGEKDCGVWGTAEFGPAYCNAKPEHDGGHRYKSATGQEYPITPE